MTHVFRNTYRIKTHFLRYLGILNAIPKTGKRNSRVATRKMKLTTAKLRFLIHKILQDASTNTEKNIFLEAHLNGKT